ncbi:MAG: HNH endonuclease [Sulfurimonas sp.]|uniref:HNH endonuclease n=1 Tax=Sulfurimonas sp. TaxID=2022749 RepID=UPI0025FB424E|nr:HNH endonuclease signature motif containing protein [Sulfurimonas sp.]MCK9492496.1 HNH endonuclease [Sulfurimonas sp.]
MKINLFNEKFTVIDTKEKITIADSFVVRQNKIGTGNGEAKLYVGNENNATRDFFGNHGFTIKCFLMKKDLLNYLNETKVEYLKPEQAYINSKILPSLWNKRKNKIDTLLEKIEFEIIEQIQISGSRIYVKSSDLAYEIIRELSLPNITFISVVKLRGQHGNIEYYFRLFADFFGDETHPYILQQEEKALEAIENIEEKKLKIKARVGQGKYREELLNQCPFCPITMVSDDRLLVASHIKPWAKSTETEKTDPFNGFMLTPTFDYLFDKGFMSFTDDKKTILSPFLSKMTYSKIGISDNKTFSLLPIKGREKYLEYHRNNILKK